MTKKLSRILHVDDERDMLDMVRNSLTAGGDYLLESCTSGQAAVALCNFFHPNLILMDFLMPDMDGVETMRQIRNIPALAQTPVIFLTAKATTADFQRYDEVNAIGIISKPFDPLNIHQKILGLYQGTVTNHDVFIDDAILQEFRDIVEEQFHELIATYLEDGQKYIQDIQSALASGDLNRAKKSAHTLKSSSGYLGAVAVKQLAEAIDNLPDNHPIDKTQQIAHRLEEAFQKTKTALSAYI